MYFHDFSKLPLLDFKVLQYVTSQVKIITILFFAEDLKYFRAWKAVFVC